MIINYDLCTYTSDGGKTYCGLERGSHLYADHLFVQGQPQSQFDQVFEEMDAPEYPATCDQCGTEGTNASIGEHVCPGGKLSSADDIECQFCGFRGTFTEGANHRKKTQHLIRTVAVGNQRRAQYEPALRAGERDAAGIVSASALQLAQKIDQIYDTDLSNHLLAAVQAEHNQRATLVEQRAELVAARIDKLRKALREILDIVEDEGHADSYVPQVTAARELLATIEPEMEVKSKLD